MRPSFPNEVHSLVTTMCESLFGDEVNVRLCESVDGASAMWVLIQVVGALPAEVWVGSSHELVQRVSSRILGAQSIRSSDLADAACELANIVAGNLKALFAPGSSLGLPALRSPEQPFDSARYSSVALSIDGASLSVVVSPHPPIAA